MPTWVIVLFIILCVITFLLFVILLLMIHFEVYTFRGIYEKIKNKKSKSISRKR